ncbi:hypothetical protein IHE44_0011351 [Lamprotornis superbus]|uniref:Uncharacterized protein n=1 Tax=Lamprotornis superbus TaxID=245042 RepID=A0A835TPD8_9PASS|nr:hypothetical protein IHE44_0011351 [Lamprotornis superbus]
MKYETTPNDLGDATNNSNQITSTDVSNKENEDSITVYVVVGIAALVCTGLVITLIILKFGRHSKFGMKGKQGLVSKSRGRCRQSVEFWIKQFYFCFLLRINTITLPSAAKPPEAIPEVKYFSSFVLFHKIPLDGSSLSDSGRFDLQIFQNVLTQYFGFYVIMEVTLINN